MGLLYNDRKKNKFIFDMISTNMGTNTMGSTCGITTSKGSTSSRAR